MGKYWNYIINHVFLPPKLPQENDSGFEETAALIQIVRAASSLLQDHIPEQQQSEWVPCIKMMRSMLELRDDFGNLMAKKVETALREMLDGGTNNPFSVDRTGG